jgi:hypothetical protein
MVATRLLTIGSSTIFGKLRIRAHGVSAGCGTQSRVVEHKQGYASNYCFRLGLAA